MAANPITFTEIDAYCRLHRITPSSWELDLLHRLDGIALKHTTNKSEPEKAQPAPGTVKDGIRSVAKDRRVVKRKPKATESLE